MPLVLVERLAAEGGAQVTARFVVGMALIVYVAFWLARSPRKAVR